MDKPVDLTNLDFFANEVPHHLFEQLRRNDPVYWNPETDGQGFWAITKYSDVVQVSKDFRTFSSEKGAVYLEEMTPDQMAARRSMLETDPPEHGCLRRLISRDFTPKGVAKWEDFITKLAKKLMDDSLAKSEFDFVHDIAGSLTMGVVAEMMGVPPGDMEELITWINQMIGSTTEDNTRLVDHKDEESLKHLPMRSKTSLKVFDYARKMAEEKKEKPCDDLLSKLVHGKMDGRSLTQQEYLMYFILLLIAGNETNRSTMSHGIITLKEHPEQLQKLQQNPELLESAIEEILRWVTPVYYFRRTATKDIEIRDKKIREGDKVVTWYTSANFDEEVFENPYVFDITRTPNPHLVFGGGGPHFCIGVWLARLELKVAFREILRHIDKLEVVSFERLKSNHFNSLDNLILKYSG